MEAKCARLSRELRKTELSAKEARSKLDEERKSEAGAKEERGKLEEKLRSVTLELNRKSRLVNELTQRIEKAEKAVLAEQSLVEQRAAHLAAEPLKQALKGKEAAVRSTRSKLECCERELSECKVELEGLRRELGAERSLGNTRMLEARELRTELDRQASF